MTDLTTRTYVRVPPDGAGKRLKAHNAYHLGYNSLTGTFTVGDEVVGGTSGVVGVVTKVIPDTATAGVIALSLEEEYFFNDSTFSATEPLLVGGIQQALAADTGTDLHINEVIIVGGNNPYYHQAIDQYGSQKTTFAEGSPQFDAFGRLSVSQRTTVDEHITKTSDLFDEDNYDFINLGTTGTASYDTVTGAVTLQQPTDSGSYSVRSTHRYYKYQAGISLQIMMTVAMGDNGTDNQTKRWGYFDRQNGLFFESSGSYVNVCVRSNTSGTPVDTRISQSAWNHDRLDGSSTEFNLSTFDLDITKNNIYFIDLQWLGAGRVRFGVVNSEGARIVAHQFQHANTLVLPYMRTADLPLTYEIINYDTTAGPRTMKTFADSVMIEGEFKPPFEHFSTETPLRQLTSSTDWTPLMSGRPVTASIKNPMLDARGWGMVQNLGFYSSQPTIIELVKNDILSGSQWGVSPNPSASFDGDIYASGSTGGVTLLSRIVDGCEHFDVSDIFGYDGELIHTKALIEETPNHYTVRAKLVSGSSNGVIQGTIDWTEIK